MRQAGEVTYADAHKPRRNEGCVEFASERVIILIFKRELLIHEQKVHACPPKGGGHCVLNGVLRGHFLGIKM